MAEKKPRPKTDKERREKFRSAKESEGFRQVSFWLSPGSRERLRLLQGPSGRQEDTCGRITYKKGGSQSDVVELALLVLATMRSGKPGDNAEVDRSYAESLLDNALRINEDLVRELRSFRRRNIPEGYCFLDAEGLLRELQSSSLENAKLVHELLKRHTSRFDGPRLERLGALLFDD